MGKTFSRLSEEHQGFIEAQQLFFVATAPLGAEGHVNLSPKGLDSFRVLAHDRVAYLDLTGSGNETSAHLLENGRITLMFCALQGSPNILRIYGRGQVHLPGTEGFDALAAHFSEFPGIRQIIVIDVDRVQTSCGFGIPVYRYEGQRDQLTRWAERKGPEGIETYKRNKNSASIDGLPTHLGQRLQDAPDDPDSTRPPRPS